MAAPAVVSVTSTLISTLTSNPTINLDASVAQGDLVYIVLCAGRNRPIGITWPAGWTELCDINNTTGNQMEQSHAWRIMPSSPPTTVQVTSAGTIAIQAWAIRIAAGDFDSGTPPEVATIINSGDPPNLDPSWGNEATRYGSSLTRDGSLGTITYPYADNQLSTNGGIFGSAAMCTGAVTADSQNPAAWVATTSGTVVMFAIRAAASGAEHQATLTADLGFTSSASATVEHPATLAGSLGFTATTTATVEHAATLSGALGFTAAIAATRETAAALASDLGFTAAADLTVEHPATSAVDLGFTGALAAVVAHPAELAADLGFAAHIEATTGSVHEATLTASIGFAATATAVVTHPAALAATFGGEATTTATVEHPAALTAGLGGTATLAAAVTHPAVFVAALGFTARTTMTDPAGGTADVGVRYRERFGATLTEPTAVTYREPVGATHREST